MTAERERMRRALQEGVDVLVVGGGINGAGLARDLALRGARVGLVEKDDWAQGTSSRSSRLVHGGLRYLEESYKSIRRGLTRLKPGLVTGGITQIGLVFESVTERYWMSRLARNLVRPQPFFFPVFRGGRVPLWQLELATSMYDALSLFRNYRNHHTPSTGEVAAAFPGMDLSRFAGAVHYFDYRTNDARLTLENVIAAREAGAAVLSRARAVAPILPESGPRRIAGALVRDELTGESFPVAARVVVSTTGPYTDEALRQLGYPPQERPLLRLTKGVHVVLPADKVPAKAAAALTHPRDGRVLFVLPFFERTVIGTTDTDWKASPGEVRVESSDVDYLLEVATHYYPSCGVTRDDVISSWSGLRPLANAAGVSESSVPREHRILRTKQGLLAIFGGKLTTYRRMVEELADVVSEELAERTGLRLGAGNTRGAPLPGADTLDTDRDLDDLELHLVHRGGVSQATAAHLAESYGDNAPALLDLAAADPTNRLKQRIEPDLPHLWAEVVWAARREMALSVEDVLVRRTSLHYRALDQGLACAAETARLLGAELGWSDARVRAETEAYERFVASSRRWREDANPPAVTRAAS